MPECFAVARVEDEKVACGIAAECQARVGGEHACSRTSGAEFVSPAQLAGLVIDRFEHSLTPHVVIGARPTVETIGGFREVDAPTRMGVDDKQSVLRVEARRTIVGQTAFVGRDQTSVWRGLFGGIRNWTALRIDSKRPVHGSERGG